MKRALVLSLGLLLVFGFAAFAQGELTGSWDTTITINPAGEVPDTNLDPSDDFFTFDSTLEITYSVGGWSFTSTTGVDSSGWSSQQFDVAGAFGAFDVSGGMKIDPMLAISDMAWIWMDTGFTFGAVEIGIDFDLYAQDIRLCLTGSGTTGLVDITVELCFGDLYMNPWYGYPMDWFYGWPYAPYFDTTNSGVLGVPDNDICDLNWSGASITVDFPFCCADVSGSLAIDCDGFDYACFEVEGIVVSNIPWFTLGAELCFELMTKTLTLSPEFDFGADICFDVYFEYNDDDVVAPAYLMLPAISIVGLGLECEIGGVSFSGISYWGDPDYAPAPLDVAVWDDVYAWEAYTIATTDEACCGPFDFDITIYFVDWIVTPMSYAPLFEISAFEANFSYELGENFIFSMGMNYNVFGDMTWDIGFEITW